MTFYASTGSPKSSSRSVQTAMGSQAVCFVSRNHFSYGARTDFPGAGCRVSLAAGQWTLTATAIDQGATFCEATCI